MTSKNKLFSYYQNLRLPKKKNRPYFYTSFVSTVDGKVHVQDREGYWPIGSRTDYEIFTLYLRSHADAIIQGKNTAMRFGSQTIKSIHRKEFLKERKRLKKASHITYYVVSSNPGRDLDHAFENEYGFRPTIITTHAFKVSKHLENTCDIVRLNADLTMNVDLGDLVKYLKKQNHHVIQMEGGPVLTASFLEKGFLDELFITIAPKIFGNEEGKTLTMVEGKLFSPKEIKNLKLITVHSLENEIFLRYKVA